MRLCFALLPVRTDHHDHVPTVLLGLRLHEAELFNIAGETLEQTEAQLGPGLLTPPEHDRHLDLVATLEEPLDVALLGAVVVRVDLRAELDLLDDRVDLVLARFASLECRFVLELAEVHELGDRRLGHRGDLDEVEVSLGGQTQRVFDAHDADLFSVGANQPHFGYPNAVVDARFADVGAPLLEVHCREGAAAGVSRAAAATKKGSPSPLRGKPHLSVTRLRGEVCRVACARGIRLGDSVDPATVRLTRVEAGAASLAHRARCWATLSGHPTMDTAGRSERLPA